MPEEKSEARKRLDAWEAYSPSPDKRQSPQRKTEKYVPKESYTVEVSEEAVFCFKKSMCPLTENRKRQVIGGSPEEKRAHKGPVPIGEGYPLIPLLGTVSLQTIFDGDHPELSASLFPCSFSHAFCQLRLGFREQLCPLPLFTIPHRPSRLHAGGAFPPSPPRCFPQSEAVAFKMRCLGTAQPPKPRRQP